MTPGIQTTSSLPDYSSDSSVTPYLCSVFALCLFANILAGIVSTLMSAHLPVVIDELVKDPAAKGNVSGIINAVFILGWAIGGMVWGRISDNIGRQKSLAFTVASFSIFSLLVGFSFSWQLIMIFRLLSGFAVGGLMVVSPTFLSEIWPEKSRAIVLGLDSIGFPVGIFSTGLVTTLISDWRQSFAWLGAGVLLSVIIMMSVRESNEWKSSYSRIAVDKKLPKEIRSAIVQGALLFGTMLIGLWALFSWIPTWEQGLVTNSDGATERGITMMLLGGSGLIGGFSSGWIGNSIGVRRSMLVCFGGCFVMSLLLFGTNNTFSSIIYAEVGLLGLFFGASQGLLSVYITQLFPSYARATATGICFNAGRFFTAASVFFVGALVTFFGGYAHSLLAFSFVFLIGFITLYFSKTNYR